MGDLDQSVSEEKLRDFFYARYKSVISAKIVIDTISKESKGFGFVQFNDQNESSKAIEEMNGKYLNGRQIKVNQASFKKFTEAMSNAGGNEKNVNDVPLNQNTIKNLNNFYIQNANDRQDAFNLSNFYCNHGKYFSGGNPYSMNNISDNINNENKKP